MLQAGGTAGKREGGGRGLAQMTQMFCQLAALRLSEPCAAHMEGKSVYRGMKDRLTALTETFQK